MTGGEARADAAAFSASGRREGSSSQTAIGLSGAFAIAAVVALGVVAYHEPMATLARQVWDGERMLRAHAIPVHFGIETATAAGMPGASIGWLAALFVAVCAHIAGVGGPLLLTIAALCGALAFANARMIRAAIPLPLRLASLSAITIAVGGIAPGEALLALVVSAALFCLDLPLDRRRACAVVCLAIVGFNLSPYAAILPVLGLLATGVAWSRDRSLTPDVRALFWTTSAMAAASFLTPAGADLPLRYASIVGFTGTPLDGADPTTAVGGAYRLAFIPFVMLALWFGLGSRRFAASAAFGCCGMILAMLDAHVLGIAAIVAVPPLTLSIADQIPQSRARAASLVGIAACLAILGAATIDRERHRVPLALDPAVAHSLERFIRDGRTHRIYCSARTRCDAVVALNVRTLSVYLDSRPGYDESLRARAHAIGTAAAGWRARLREAKIDTLVLESPQALASLADLDPRWRLVEKSKDVAVYERAVR